MQTVRLHNPLVIGIKECLKQIFVDNYYADKVIERAFKKNRRWGARDRGIVAETVYDIVRWWRMLCEVNNLNYEKFEVHTAALIIQSYFFLYRNQNAEWKDLPLIDFKHLKQKFDELSKVRVYRESIPDWLDERGVNELGSRWDREIAAQNGQAPIVIRVNTLKATIEEVQRELYKKGIETKRTQFSSTGLILAKRTNLFTFEIFKKGWFELQDESSQHVVNLLAFYPVCA